MKRFCFLSFFENKFAYDYEYVKTKLNEIKEKFKKFDFENDKFIYDLKLAVALWIEDNGLLSFAHRSLQEYFASAFIKGLNDDNKKSVYDKLKNKSSVNRFGENKNLLSLCDEMDHISFLKFFYLPILIEIKNLVKE